MKTKANKDPPPPPKNPQNKNNKQTNKKHKKKNQQLAVFSPDGMYICQCTMAYTCDLHSVQLFDLRTVARK